MTNVNIVKTWLCKQKEKLISGYFFLNEICIFDPYKENDEKIMVSL